jgi:hypothetical protein
LQIGVAPLQPRNFDLSQRLSRTRLPTSVMTEKSAAFLGGVGS